MCFQNTRVWEGGAVFAQSSGTLSSVNLPALDSGLTWDDTGLYTSGTIAVIPEPYTPLLLARAGILGLRRRRIRNAKSQGFGI